MEIPSHEAYADILMGLDGASPTSTGHERALDVYTGKRRARGWGIVPAAVPVGRHRVEVRLVRRDGAVDASQVFVFDPAAERFAEAKRIFERLGDRVLSFAEHGDEVTWLGFSTFFDRRDSLREIRYSVDGCSLDERVIFADDPTVEPAAEGRRTIRIPCLIRVVDTSTVRYARALQVKGSTSDYRKRYPSTGPLEHGTMPQLLAFTH